jgi:hypothetical protein
MTSLDNLILELIAISTTLNTRNIDIKFKLAEKQTLVTLLVVINLKSRTISMRK